MKEHQGDMIVGVLFFIAANTCEQNPWHSVVGLFDSIAGFIFLLMGALSALRGHHD